MLIPLSTTAAAAKICVVLYALPSPTVIKIPEPLVQPTQPIQQATSVSPLMVDSISLTAKVANDNWFLGSSRPTTAQENIIGQIRQFSTLKANWDGEGAVAPSNSSLKEAVAFVRLLALDVELLEPMILASGHAALYRNDDGSYADIEFLGDGRIAYFIKTNDGKHKGVVDFNSQKMPAVFPALIKA